MDIDYVTFCVITYDVTGIPKSIALCGTRKCRRILNLALLFYGL
jgi:hypothetical protein